MAGIDFDKLAIIHLGATGFMVGLMWTIHTVHYPLFALVNEPYRPFQEAHMSRISGLLVVPWGVEVLTAVGLLLAAAAGQQRALSIIGLVLIGVVLALTAFGAAPLHGQLVDQFDPEIHQRLMQVDLVRTLGWTARLVVAGWIVWIS